MLNKIIESRGCVVQDKEFRGMRPVAEPKQGSDQLAPKVRKHERALQMSPTVPHIDEIAPKRRK